jgi:hypothetical protein
MPASSRSLLRKGPKPSWPASATHATPTTRHSTPILTSYTAFDSRQLAPASARPPSRSAKTLLA